MKNQNATQLISSKTIQNSKILRTIILLFLIQISLNNVFGAANPLPPSGDSLNNYFHITPIQDAYYDSLINIYGIDSMQGTGFKDYIRWKGFMNMRVDENGTLDTYINSINNYYDQSNPSSTADWTYYSPVGIPSSPGSHTGFGKGWVNRILFESNLNIYAGTHNSGIWRTINSGVDWNCITSAYPKINGIASLCYNNNDDIYALTFANISNYSNGIYKATPPSSNDPWVWSEVIIPDMIDNDGDFYPAIGGDRTPKKILFHPTNDNILFVLTRSYILKYDSGQNPAWTLVCDMDEEFILWGPGQDWGFEDIIFDSDNPEIMYVSGTLILKSTNTGNSWIDITNDVTDGLERIITCKMDAISVYEGKVWFFYTYHDELQDKNIAAIVKFDPASGGTYEPIYSRENSGYLNAGAWKINIKVHPGDENKMYIAGWQIYVVYSDQGEYTSEIITTRNGYGSVNYLHDDVRDMYFDYSGSTQSLDMYIGCDGGVVKVYEVSGFENWETTDLSIRGSNRETDLNISEVYAISTSGNNGKIAFNCQDIGGYYDDDDLYYTGVGDGGAMLFDNIYDEYFYACDIGSGFFAHNTIEHSNISLFVPYSYEYGIYFFPPIVKDPGNSNVVYFGNYHLWKQNDIYALLENGEQVASEMVHVDGTNPLKPITDIAISNINPDIMYVSTKKIIWWNNPMPPLEDAFYKSTDGGISWSDISADIPGIIGGFITDIVLNPENDDEYWLTFGLSSDEKKVYRFYRDPNNPENWLNETYTQELPDKLPVYEMIIDEMTNDMYLATDIGVFKRAYQSDEWENISYNQAEGVYKQCMVYDIEINHSERKLYASTFGGGIWHTDLGDCPSFNQTPYTVSAENDEIWTKPMFMNRDLIIEPEASLIIKDVVYFHENAKVIVKRSGIDGKFGGKLEINGGKLTNSCNGDEWKGIEVEGHSDKQQNAVEQGWLYITNNGCIENARIGILANRTSSSESFVGFTGGVIRANEAVFINNQVAIKLENLDEVSLSDIYNCTFVSNDDWQIGGASPLYFIELNNYCNYGQLEISACKFINKAEDNQSVKGKGYGIYSTNSSFTVDQLCANENYPCSEYLGCSFDNLEYGIHATDPLYRNLPVSIKNSEFIDNKNGIYLGTLNYAEVTSNTFQVKDVGRDAYGLYLDQCMGYHVEANTFSSIEDYLGTNYGIIVNYSVKAANEIYRNNFNTIYCGISSQDENRGLDGIGLSLRCNVFQETEFDIISIKTLAQQGTYWGIAANQGTPTSYPPDPLDMAGNQFHYNSPQPDGDFDDLYNYYDSDYPTLSCRHFNYYYPIGSSVPAVNPKDFNDDNIDKYPTNFEPVWDYSVGCPSKLENIGGGSLRSLLYSETQQIDSLDNAIVLLVDGGDTDELENEVNNCVPPETMIIYNQLLSESPYLSDTVVSTSIGKEDVLPNAMIRDIMVANTHTSKSDALMEKLDERTDPMPDYMKAEILQGRDSISQKEENEAMLFRYKLQKAHLFNELVRLYMCDTIDPISSSDSLESLLNNDNYLLSEYQLAFLHLDRDEYQLGSNVLSDVPNNFELTDDEYSEHQSLVDYYNILSAAAQVDSTAVWPDSTQLQHLWDIYNNGTGIACTYTRNLLVVYDTLTYNEPIAYPNVFKSAPGANAVYNILNSGKPDFLKVLPNPAKDYIVIEYELEMQKQSQIRISDINGKPIHTLFISRIHDQEIINTGNWAQGIYIASLLTNNKLLQSIKFTIAK